MQPKTINEAYQTGYDDANGPMRIGSYWPHEEDFVNPNAHVRAFMRGYSDGQKDAHRNDMSGCQS